MKKFLKFFLATILVHGMGQCGSIAATKTTIKADIVEGIDTEYDFLKGAGHYEKNVLGTSAYKDSAGVEPVDGTGGSPTLTCTRTTSSPIDGAGSLLITHTASNLQGEGCSIPFTIENRDKNKVLSIKFSGRVASGTFVAGSPSADGDLTFYVYDVTNSVLIRPSTSRIYSGSTTDTEDVVSSFQTTSSTSYRLIIHNGTTNSSAWTYQVDALKVSRSKYVYGSPITDWVDYGPMSVTAPSPPTKGGAVLDKFLGRRVGGNLEFRYNYRQTSGGSNGTLNEGRFVLPAGIPAIDTSKVTANASAYADGSLTDVSGSGYYTATTGSGSTVHFVVYDSSSFRMIQGPLTNGTGTSQFFPISGVSGFGATTMAINIVGSVPIQGWGSSVQMSSDADTRVVAASGTVTVAANTVAVKGTLTTSVDTHGSIASNEFTVPVPGFYTVNLSLQGNAGGGVAHGEGHIYLNGVAVATSADGGDYTRSVAPTYGAILKIGDKISFYANVSPAYGAWNGNWVISRSAGPGTIAANEDISASYWMATGANATTTTPVNFDTKEYDTHNAVTVGSSWKFTAPANGKYRVSGVLASSTGSANVWAIFKNGTGYKNLNQTSNTYATTPFATSIYLKQGEYIDIRPGTTMAMTGSTTLFNTSSFSNNIAIERVSAF